MVDHHPEAACGIFSRKSSPVAMAVASTDYLQDVDAALTPKIAPSTPMQALQKPQQARESTNALSSFFLGRESELKGPFINTNMHNRMPTRSGLAGVETSSKLDRGIQLDNQKGPQQDESLLSFCLSKYEKKYQIPDMATPLCNRTGPLSLHTVHAQTGCSNMLLDEACVSPGRHVTHPDTQGLCTVLKELPEKSLVHADKPEKKLFNTPTSVTGVSYDAEVNDVTARYSPAPGAVAHDAYELYSKMFPSTFTATTEQSSSSTNVDVGVHLPSPFLEHMDNIQLLQPVCYDQKPLIRDRCELNDEHLESGKKIKFAKIKEEDTAGGYIDVKKEPIFYEPSRTADFRSSAASSHGDTKPSQMPPESLSTVLCSPNSGKVINSTDYSGGCAGRGPAEATSMQQAVGLKLFTSSAHMHMPNNLSIVTAKEPSVPLSLEPSTRALSKASAQGSLSTDADWGRYLALSATPAGNTEIAIMLPFQQRFKELQAFLKQCDDADQNECMQALRTLSAGARSGYAVELETRAIRLSLEEGKEMKRMRLLNVLGKISEGNLDNAGATPHGPRLPAPGAAPMPKHVL